MNKIISFGGGVNSVAMTIMLYKRGEIYPCVFADTMAEHPETYCYMDYFEKEFMGKYGQKIVRLHPYLTTGYYQNHVRYKGLIEYCLDHKIVCLAMQPWCSNSYKRQPIKKYAPKPHIVGFSMEENNRATDDIYPLIEEGINREGCRKIIKEEGLLMPDKSGCWFCPNQRIDQWEKLYRVHPDLYQKAVDLENNSHLQVRSDYSLEQLRERIKTGGWKLLIDYDFEELTPCMCIT